MKHFLYGTALVLAWWSGAGCSEKKVRAASPSKLGEPVLHFGCCDASAGVAVSSNLFLVANDEDNQLRVYRRDRSGPPTQAFEVGSFLGVDARKPESDLEASARMGDRIYWITSHGRSRTGQERESRHRFFATSIHLQGEKVELKTVGRRYERLLEDLVGDPRLIRFRLQAASLLPPKEPGALNIEGLCTTPENHLLIGFRNPIPDGKALLVPLLNAAAVVEGKKPELGDPVLLDLGSKGVRSMALANGRYLIAAGSHDGKGQTKLYAWTGGPEAPVEFTHTHLKGVNVEALLLYPGLSPDEVQILSDDGTRKVGSGECKLLKDARQKRFRSYWIKLDAPVP